MIWGSAMSYEYSYSFLTPLCINVLICTDEAKKLLEEFGKLYLKSYGATVFEKIKEEHLANKDEDNELKLKYRPVNIQYNLN